jgi:hypothetical protein
MASRMFVRRKQTRPAGRQLSFEVLEDRSMLSVNAFKSITTLVIAGTSASERIQAWQSGGNWKVQGLAGTRVNGNTAATTFTGVTDMLVELGAGNDFLNVFNGTLSGNLTVLYSATDAGAKTNQFQNIKAVTVVYNNHANGRNTIAANLIHTTANAIFETGDGDDVFSMLHFTTGGNVDVFAGDGNNSIVLDNVKTAGSQGDAVETGSGRDAILISGLSSSTTLVVKSGDGTDVVALSSINIGTHELFSDVGAGNNDVLVITESVAHAFVLLDTNGVNGFLCGAGNSFAVKLIDPTFWHRAGDL